MSVRPILGWSRWDPTWRVPVVYPGDAHLGTISQPGGGKSRSVAIPNLIHFEGSMAVLDMKGGELTRATALWRSTMLGQSVWVFDPFRVLDPKYLPKLNGQPCYATADPLDFIARARSPQAAAYRIAEAAIPPDTMRESHWAEGAQGRFVATMMFVKFDPRFDGFGLDRAMKIVWLLLSNPGFEKEALRLMATSQDSFVADQASAFLKAGKDNREMQGIRNQIRVACGKTFSEPAILDCLSSTNVDFSQIGKVPTTYYIVIPGDLAQTHNKFMRILITMMLGEIEKGGLSQYGA